MLTSKSLPRTWCTVDDGLNVPDVNEFVRSNEATSISMLLDLAGQPE